MRPLEWGKLPEFTEPTPAFISYWERFDGDGDFLPRAWNLLGQGDSSLAVLTLPPQKGRTPQGVVLFFHGYLSHNGNFQALFRFISSLGWWVVAADLPGHGLSGPRVRGAMTDFAGYGTAVERVTGWISSVQQWKTLPLVAMGHSTGASALLVYHQTHPGVFTRMILSAPLVKPVLFGPSSAAMRWISPWTSYLPSAESGDPLGVPYVPLSWFSALEAWNRRILEYVENSVPLLLLTGDKDQVVDTEYNIPLVSSLYPQSRLRIFPGSDHFLLQEKSQREKVFPSIQSFLEEISPKNP